MGSCYSSDPDPAPGTSYTEFEYPQHLTLKLTKASAIGSMIGSNTIDLSFTAPISQKVFSVPIGSRYMKVTGCVLPGLDPKGEDKPCQDVYQVLAMHGSLFVLLFDGHGTEGHKVSAFCVEWTESFIVNHYDEFVEQPKATIIGALEECNEKLAQSGINCDLSGSTAILLFIHENSIHSGCLGDSRAILGTLTDSLFPINPPQNNRVRMYTVTRMLKPIPLTTDQKPDNTEEIVRIRKSGGIIEKFQDSFSPSGHYRVCLPDASSALSMSRSLGDRLAHQFGVTSEPVYQYFSMYSSMDQYIVVASDGVWDVMDNLEVLNFVEMWRDRCSQVADDVFPANCKNSTVARMLAEECRYRWLSHVQNEGSVIDDISCVVIDFSKLSESLYGSMVDAEQLKQVTKGFKHLG
jgi:serine/threonine protein phosphatase PrpC